MNVEDRNYALDKRSGIERVGRIIDYAALFLLGFACYLYSIFGSDFAESRVSFSFLNFPIFVGEILLAVCLLLLFVKWKIIKLRFNKIHYLVFVYLGFVLFKALRGYCEGWGALAFRHAALFYYPLFALVGYYFYNEEFFRNPKIRSTLLAILVITAFRMLGNTFPFFLFNYWMLILLLVLTYRERFIRKWLFFILLFLLLFRFRDLYQINRSSLVSSLVAMYSCFLLILAMLNLKARMKVAIGLALFIILNSGAILFTNRSAVKSLISPQEVAARYKEAVFYVSENEAKFKFAKIKPKLFNPNRKKYVYDEVYVEQKPTTIKKASEAKDMADKQKEQGSLSAKAAAKKPQEAASARASYREEIVQFSSPLMARKPVMPAKIKPQGGDTLKRIDSGLVSADMIKLSLKKSESRSRGMDNELGNIVFRLLIWRDVLLDFIGEKAALLFGFDFGKPLRSKSIEILRYANSEWTRDGWISTHNSYLTIFYYTGLTGLILIFVFLYNLLYRMPRVFLSHKSYSGIFLFSALVYWAIIANFMVILEFPHWSIPFWALFGMTLKISANLTMRPKSV